MDKETMENEADELGNKINNLMKYMILNNINFSSWDYLSNTDLHIEHINKDILNGLKEIVEEIIYKANEVLITSKGNPNYIAMDYLKKKYNLTVVRGEYDSFGWLSGVILTPRGKIVYG